MKKIVLLRHGQSQWNLENRFTGWTDVQLSDKGVEEARQAGRLMLAAGVMPQVGFTSYLSRAIHTLQYALTEMNRDWIPVIKDWHLNERHYGALQGLNKADTAQRYGDEQVRQWRRSFDVTPPPLTIDDERYPGRDPRYADLTADELPLTESLQLTINRVRCCWEERIVPSLRGRDVALIAAHGNSLRGLAMMMQHLTPQEIIDVEIPTGKPWVFEVDDRMAVIRQYYL